MGRPVPALVTSAEVLVCSRHDDLKLCDQYVLRLWGNLRERESGGGGGGASEGAGSLLGSLYPSEVESRSRRYQVCTTEDEVVDTRELRSRIPRPRLAKMAAARVQRYGVAMSIFPSRGYHGARAGKLIGARRGWERWREEKRAGEDWRRVGVESWLGRRAMQLDPSWIGNQLCTASQDLPHALHHQHLVGSGWLLLAPDASSGSGGLSVPPSRWSICLT